MEIKYTNTEDNKNTQILPSLFPPTNAYNCYSDNSTYDDDASNSDDSGEHGGVLENRVAACTSGFCKK